MFLLSPFAPWQSYSLFFFLSFYFFVALVSYYLMYTGKGVCEPETRRDGRSLLAFFCLFFKLFLCYLAVHVKCTVYHFSDCITAEVLSLCWPRHRGTGPNELRLHRAWKRLAGQKDCHWSALTSSWLILLTWMQSGWDARPAARCGRLNRDNVEPQTPFHLLVDMARKYIDLYTYICVYIYIHK